MVNRIASRPSDRGIRESESSMDIFRTLTRGTRLDRTSPPALTEALQKKQAGPAATALDFFGEHVDTISAASPVEGSWEKKKRKSSVSKTSSAFTREDMHVYRKRHLIKVYGDNVPPPLRSFEDLFSSNLLSKEHSMGFKKAIEMGGYIGPTPIQMQAIPCLLDGRDLLACAPTGSGKTLAFILPTLASIPKTHSREGYRVLVLSPTRELATQIFEEYRKTANNGELGEVQVSLLNRALFKTWESRQTTKFGDILVTTPLRLIKAIKKGLLTLDQLKTMILDEADKLLEHGFLPQLDYILSAIPKSLVIRKALFSATIPTGVEQIAKTFMNEPLRIVIGRSNAAVGNIEQKLLFVGQESGKTMAIRQMLVDGLAPPVLIFIETVDRANRLYEEFKEHGIKADVMHASRSAADRMRILKNFRSGRIWFLITTELLSRGLDFSSISHVINYDFPLNTASYIHRIGRTGRAGNKGTATTLFTREDAGRLAIVVNVMRESGYSVPEWMLALKKSSKNDKAQRFRRRKAKEAASKDIDMHE